jgi:hypothetical protein
MVPKLNSKEFSSPYTHFCKSSHYDYDLTLAPDACVQVVLLHPRMDDPHPMSGHLIYLCRLCKSDPYLLTIYRIHVDDHQISCYPTLPGVRESLLLCKRAQADAVELERNQDGAKASLCD